MIFRKYDFYATLCKVFVFPASRNTFLINFNTSTLFVNYKSEYATRGLMRFFSPLKFWTIRSVFFLFFHVGKLVSPKNGIYYIRSPNILSLETTSIKTPQSHTESKQSNPIPVQSLSTTIRAIDRQRLPLTTTLVFFFVASLSLKFHFDRYSDNSPNALVDFSIIRKRRACVACECTHRTRPLVSISMGHERIYVFIYVDRFVLLKKNYHRYI